jgi:hypothetical protein
MSRDPELPPEGDSEQLDRSAEAIDEAKAAAGRVAKDDSISTGDLPSEQASVPAAPPTDAGDRT